MEKIHLIKSGIVRTSIIILISLLLISLVGSVDFEQVYNPFTRQLDYYRTSNFTGENITVNNINADGNITALKFFGLFNWTEVGIYTTFNNATLTFDEALLNTTIETIFTADQYNGSTINTIEGTYDSGDIESIRTPEDSDTYNVSEDAGAAPVLTININFTGVSGFDSVIGRIYYSGGQGHEIQLEIRRNDTGDWENYAEYTDMIDYVNIYIPVFDELNHISTDGNVSIRFDHSQNGIASHDFSIDYLILVNGFTALTTADHDSLSGRDNPENHPWALSRDGTKNMTGNLYANAGINLSFDFGKFINLNSTGNITAEHGIISGGAEAWIIASRSEDAIAIADDDANVNVVTTLPLTYWNQTKEGIMAMTLAGANPLLKIDIDGNLDTQGYDILLGGGDINTEGGDINTTGGDIYVDDITGDDATVSSLTSNIIDITSGTIDELIIAENITIMAGENILIRKDDEGAYTDLIWIEDDGSINTIGNLNASNITANNFFGSGALLHSVNETDPLFVAENGTCVRKLGDTMSGSLTADGGIIIPEFQNLTFGDNKVKIRFDDVEDDLVIDTSRPTGYSIRLEKGSYKLRTNTTWAAWARSLFALSDGAGNPLGQFGGLGDDGTHLAFMFIGRAWNDVIIEFDFDNDWVEIPGRLGIGTTSPSSSLQIVGGNIELDYGKRIQGGSAHNSIDIGDGAMRLRSKKNWYIDLDRDGSGVDACLYINEGTAQKHRFCEDGTADISGDLTAGTIQADDGFTGTCINATYVGGIATGCND